MGRRERLSVAVLAALGAVLVAAGAVLFVVGSFASLGIASLGMFVLAAALIIRAVPSSGAAAAALLALAGVGCLVVGMVATPVYYAGWGLLAGSIATALVARARRS